MKWIIIFVGFFCITSSKAQSNVDRANALLTEAGIDSERYSLNIYQETPFGTFVSIERIKNVTVVSDDLIYNGEVTDTFETYMKADGKISLVSDLQGFRVFGYLSSTQAFIVGRYDVSSLTDSRIEEIYKYDLNSKLLIGQGTYPKGVYGVRIHGKNMSLLLDVENYDSVGSSLIYVPFPLH